jgi:phospholipid/cholesterol/gamma-HCH transport system substrate-binding protein
MENRSHALAAGAFVLLMAALLVAMAVWLTRDTQEHRIYLLSTREAVTGLQPQATVRYKGVVVGRVSAIGLDPAKPGHVLVRIAVNDDVPVTTSTFAALGFQGVTGLAFIQLDDAGESKVALAGTPAEPGQIPVRAGLFTRLQEQGAGLLAQLDETSRRANYLLAPDNQKTLMEAIASMGKAAEDLGKIAKEAEQQRVVREAALAMTTVQTSAQRVGASADVVKTSAAAFERVTTRMNATGGTLDEISAGVDAITESGRSFNAVVAPKLTRTADEAARAARQWGRVAEMAESNPQSLLWGQSAPAPGPGEPGFVAPVAR